MYILKPFRFIMIEKWYAFTEKFFSATANDFFPYWNKLWNRWQIIGYLKWSATYHLKGRMLSARDLTLTIRRRSRECRRANCFGARQLQQQRHARVTRTGKSERSPAILFRFIVHTILVERESAIYLVSLIINVLSGIIALLYWLTFYGTII